MVSYILKTLYLVRVLVFTLNHPFPEEPMRDILPVAVRRMAGVAPLLPGQGQARPRLVLPPRRLLRFRMVQGQAYALRTTTGPVMYRGVAHAGIFGVRPAQPLRKSKRRAKHAAASCEHGHMISHFDHSPCVKGPISLFSLKYG